VGFPWEGRRARRFFSASRRRINKLRQR